MVFTAQEERRQTRDRLRPEAYQGSEVKDLYSFINAYNNLRRKLLFMYSSYSKS